MNSILKLTIAKAPTGNLLLNTKMMALHPLEAPLTLQPHLLLLNRWLSQKGKHTTRDRHTESKGKL